LVGFGEVKRFIFAIAFGIHGVSLADLGNGLSSGKTAYNSAYVAFPAKNLEHLGELYKCAEKGPYLFIEFHGDEADLKKHKKGDRFYLVSHSGRIVVATLIRVPYGSQDPACKTVVEYEGFDETIRRFFGILRPNEEISWFGNRDCYDRDAVMAISGNKPDSGRIGAVFHATDVIRGRIGDRSNDDPRTLELAKKARSLILALIEKKPSSLSFYKDLMIGTAYRILSPDRKHEYLFENIAGPADGAQSFLFRVDSNGLKLIRQMDTYACVFNSVNLDQDQEFEIFEDFFTSRLTSSEVIFQFKEKESGETKPLKTLGGVRGD
jgi:hypothetical protein